MLRVGLEACPYCDSLEVYRSQPETWLDGMLAPFLFDISRCHGCMRQHFRPLMFPAPDFPVRSEGESTKTIAIDERSRRSE